MPFGIGRALKRVGKEVVGAVEDIGNEIERAASKAAPRKLKRELQRAADFGENALQRYASGTTALLGGNVGQALAGFEGYNDTVADEEERAYQRQAEREAKERAKKEAERGQDLLRRRRMRRLGSLSASGFGSASTDYKTVLGV